jgi:hypothetical protein
LAQGERAFQTLINGARFLAAASALMLDFLALALLTENADGQFVVCATLMWFGLLPAVNPIPVLLFGRGTLLGIRWGLRS